MDFPEKLKLNRSQQEFIEAKKNIPGGVLGIRRPYNFVEGEYPIYFDSGRGGRVTDIDGNEYIDYLCAYGPVILGYRETEVDESVIHQIRDKGFCFSLSQTAQNHLAAEFRRLIPCAEMTLFVKTGSDATTCAVRLARAHTGRDGVLRCGYHGWHDWCVEVKGGIPEKLYEDVEEFPYNDLERLEQMLKRRKGNIAAIIITPFGHPLAQPLEAPEAGYLAGVRALADDYGAVLIFDEIRTGFRLSMGGAQQLYGVTPDLAVFGKAMANGYAIGAVTGRKDIMGGAEKDVFISSTFFPNSLAVEASLKTIEIMERDGVLQGIWKKGEKFLGEIQTILDENPKGARLSGLPPMFFITFDRDSDGSYKTRRKKFYTGLIRRGIFLQPYHHGYLCHRHTEEDLSLTLEVIHESLKEI